MDFKHLYETHLVSVQLGGSDQWRNIVPGVDLVRRLCRQTVYGLTCPLVTKADGEVAKFGKTESGPIWLSANRTSPYSIYQFFLNTLDDDVAKFLRFFTFLPLDQIADIEQAHFETPEKRIAHRILAEEVTCLIHGQRAAKGAEEASQRLFNGDVSTLPISVLLEVLNGAPTTTHSLTDLRRNPRSAVDFPHVTSVCSSKREARELLTSGAVTVNGRKLSDSDLITVEDLLSEKASAIRKGKKNWYLAIWQ